MFQCTLITTVSILRLANLMAARSPEDLDTSNSMVFFRTEVSILDKYDKYRYSTDELIPLFALVATRFTKVFVLDYIEHVPDDEFEPENKELRNHWPGFAAAKYNCLSSTRSKIQLFLGSRGPLSCNCTLAQQIAQSSIRLADEVNKFCNDTITTIFLSLPKPCPSIVAYCGQELNLSRRYKWGETIDATHYCDPGNMWNATVLPTVVMLVFFGDKNQMLNINVSNCKPYREMSNKKPTVIKTTNYISNPVAINTKLLLNFWKEIATYREDSFMHLEAFGPNGWWDLVNEPGNTNTSQFVFEEKVKVAAKINMDKTATFQWHRVTEFHKNMTGILFQGHFSNYSVEKDFCRVMCTQELDDFANVRKKLSEMMALCGESFNMIFLIDKLSQTDLNHLIVLNKKKTTILVPVIVDRPDHYRRRRNEFNASYSVSYDASYPKIVNALGFKLGYYVEMDVCGYYNRLDIEAKRALNNIFANPDSSTHIFHYNLYDENKVLIEATRMFRDQNVLFDLCRKLVFNTRNTTTQIGFAVKGYYRSSKFYHSSWEMNNYLKYIDLMSKWVYNHSDSVIFFSHDQHESFELLYWPHRIRVEQAATVGWYPLIEFLEKKGYTRNVKETRPFPIEDNNYDSNISLNNNQLVIAVVSILIIFSFLILIAIYIVRHYKKRYQLSNEERDLFFEGISSDNRSDTRNPNDIPYDKIKYEIPEGNFKIDTTQKLGSGAFGMVCRGTVNISEEEIQVAVKTTNPQKLHKTVLKGLLSEIKILSHIGLHPNIIKLFGAHTVNIRTGKVYVFLELCHLGSLLNYLQNLGLVSADHDTDAESKKDTKYVNTASSNNYLLDASLSNDLCRWSKEICNGMTFLAEKCVVHADLATRNVLLNLRREAKICDFGLSRRMYNYESYVKSQQEPLPWKWMAPETLRYMQFNEKTDVWAFGVTLWELYSLGSVPYAGLSWDANFVQMLEGGLVPSKPDFEEKNMYKIMQDCWKVIPDQRPSFIQIMSLLDVPNAETSDNKDDGEADVPDDALYQNV